MGVSNRESPLARLVSSFEQVAHNIALYAESLEKHPGLADRIRQHRAWYALRGASGQWLFGPSKFIGHRDIGVGDYLASYDRKTGTETESKLKLWFRPVDAESALGRELRAAFEQFADRYGKAPHAGWRVSVPSEMLTQLTAAGDWQERIAFDPELVHGGARIRGTRVRVIDILAALAAGDTADEIVAALPYISRADIQAALQYAVASLDHRVLAAA